LNLFESHFAEVYGERWTSLRAALLLPHEKKARSCFGGFSEYVLDEASILAAQALGVRGSDLVLDMCSAPGGKGLILLEALTTGSIILNEVSANRRRRLDEVVRTHVPPAYLPKAQVTGYDANQFGLKRENKFDRVLLDAPCSSERHLLEQDSEMKEWKVSRTKQLAQRQYSLLCSALLALKPGGTLIYSTCSISPLENDGVVERLLERKKGTVEVDPETSDLDDLEKTRFGFQVFPDRAQGMGPIYFSRLRKV
jgi:16S rRNA C967 or C1407 C5-methylase (RsmB/RsmF family)